MRRAFRLATVQRLRGAALDDAARGLARARQDVALAAARRDDVAAALAACVAGSTTTTAELQAAHARRVALRTDLETAGRDLGRAREAAAAALAAWTAARADLRAVETLHERHREALREDDARREQRLVDDLAGTRRGGGAFR